jgi:hypothetical protein
MPVALRRTIEAYFTTLQAHLATIPPHNPTEQTAPSDQTEPQTPHAHQRHTMAGPRVYARNPRLSSADYAAAQHPRATPRAPPAPTRTKIATNRHAPLHT